VRVLAAALRSEGGRRDEVDPWATADGDDDDDEGDGGARPAGSGRAFLSLAMLEALVALNEVGGTRRSRRTRRPWPSPAGRDLRERITLNSTLAHAALEDTGVQATLLNCQQNLTNNDNRRLQQQAATKEGKGGRRRRRRQACSTSARS